MNQRVDSSKLTSPEQVLGLIDEYGSKHKYMMNVGAEKGTAVSEIIAANKPQVMLEFGSYIGYSTILFAAAMKRVGGKQYVSFEREPKFACIAESLVEMAGLSDVVRIVVGSSSKNLLKEHEEKRLDCVDMIFFDHYKPAYVKDLKICESLGLIGKGTVLAADNVISPGNPTYLEYVRSSVQEKRNRLTDQVATDDGKPEFPNRTVNQYKPYEVDDTELPGAPELIYESRLIHSREPTGEPDGIEITICKGSDWRQTAASPKGLETEIEDRLH